MASAITPAGQDQTTGTIPVQQIIGFTRVLRDNGFPIGVREDLDALAITKVMDATKAPLMRQGWRSLLCTNKSDWHRFDEIFDAYWLRRGMKRAARVSGLTRNGLKPISAAVSAVAGSGPPERVERTAGDDGGTSAETTRQGASSQESLLSTDVRHLNDPDEFDRACDLAERLAAKMKVRITRRERAGTRGRRLDLRRIIHRSIATGGLPLRLAFRNPKPKPMRLVLMLDVSGSMSQYSTFFLRFIRGVLGAFRDADAFVFHTRLTAIGDVLRERNAERAMERLALITTGWSGGTRIGDSLAAFNAHHAKRVLNSRTVVMILSDGYDTGAPKDLARELARIKRRARRVVWLNPMIGWKDYAPVAGGMAAALAHIDLFAPAHNLDSLMALEPYLEKL